MTPETKTEYTLRIPSATDNLEIIRMFVSSVARKVGFTEDAVNTIELAVDEACSNVIEHAYDGRDDQDIGVAVRIDYRKLTVLVTDRGKSFDFKGMEMPDMKKYLAEIRVGGLGIYLMKMLMDEVDYRSDADGNEVRMVKYRIPPKRAEKK
jgi:serine/threonine-protein kinase RsbW